MLLAGPLLSNLAVTQSISIPYVPLNGPHAIRLIASLLALAILWTLAFAASQEVPDNGRGSSFFRSLVLPLTTLVVMLFAHKAFTTVGLPLIEQLGPTRFAMGYAISLVGTGLWVTAAWILHQHSLHEAVASSTHARRQVTQALSDHDNEGQGEAADPSEPITTMATSVITSYTPSMLGRYKVLKELGRGAMGLVYLGKDPTIQRFVAIKTMRLDHIDQDDKLQEIKARFFREAESTGRLSHPNIVTIYDAGEENDLGYIAMELIEGTPLSQSARKPNLMPVNEVLLTIATVADALDYAHQQGGRASRHQAGEHHAHQGSRRESHGFRYCEDGLEQQDTHEYCHGHADVYVTRANRGQESGRSVGYFFHSVLYCFNSSQGSCRLRTTTCRPSSSASPIIRIPPFNHCDQIFPQWCRRSSTARYRKSCLTAIGAQMDSQASSAPACRVSRPKGGIVWHSNDWIASNPIPASNGLTMRIVLSWILHLDSMSSVTEWRG